MNTLSTRLSKVPPFVCAVIASNRRRKFDHAVIAARSGLSLRMVQRLAAQIGWDNVKLGVASRYAAACGVDLLRPWVVQRYMAESCQAKYPLPHLSALQRKAFHRRMERLVEKGEKRL